MPASSSGSRTGRRSRRTRCWSGAGRGLRSWRPRASSTCCTCAARIARTSTGSAPGIPIRSCRSNARSAFAAGSARTASSHRSTSTRCPTWATAEAIAVCLLFSFRDPSHEQAVVAELRRRHPEVHIVASHESAPEFREYERASTTAADAYLGPLLGRYLLALASRCEQAGLPVPLIMRSSGGVAPLEEAAAHAARALLSGPAAGVVGASRVARLAGIENALAFDMGGTSTDVCAIVGGEATRSSERLVGGLPIRLPTLDVHTVGAGGGSIVWRDAGGALRVGPESAGAEPGPACYGRGGELPTVTDANLLLGRLPARLAGGLELDHDAAERALASVGAAPVDVIAVVNAEMLAALRVVTVERGLDPRDFALVAFGGAGALHACALAEELEIGTVLVPEAAGVLSALGLALSDERHDTVRSLVVPLDGAELPADGRGGHPLRRSVVRAHRPARRRRGRCLPPSPPGSLRLRRPRPAARAGRAADGDCRARPRVRPSPRGGRPNCDGPGRAERLDRVDPAGLAGRLARRLARGDPRVNVQLQVLGYALRAVAEEMGAALIRSAFSANIKERRDCSTAIFDAAGRMVAQAEHIPVHLGAMPASVAAVIACDPGPDDVFILNDPYAGGTHLPDITLVSRTELGFAATRAHHADVGGATPGSMPADSRTLQEEGVVIPPTLLDEAALEALVAQMRNPDERRGDLRAQLAAQHLGARRIAELCARRGRDEVIAAMDELVAYSERRVRAGIAALPDGRYEASERLETADGELELRVAVTVAGEELELDFAGTAPQHDGNLNCPLAVTTSACLFVVRALTDPDVPASAGALVPVTVRAPEGCLVNARPPAAVAAGNVETSSRIVDLLFRAFAQAVPVPAQGQGTMNNVILGNERFTYYETIGGGQGACPDGDGPSGVHVAMSNTLSTPTEALELAYPLRVERHALRLGSGGGGAHRGGDGVVRELRALEACRLSLLSQRRRIAPSGVAGGEPGAPGRTLLNGDELPPFAERELEPGDLLRVETPGGGGYGTT